MLERLKATLMATDSAPTENADETQLYLPEEWLEAADAIAYDSTTSPPPICVVCGPPNSAKTTFSSHLLNVLIRRFRSVAYFDADVDQPEFTLPGCLSLTVINKVTPDTGYDTVVNMLKYIAPSHVVKVRGDQSTNLPRGDFWLEEGTAHDVTVVEIDSNCQDSFKNTVYAQNNKHLLRDLRLLAYFRKCFPMNTSLRTIEELDHRLAAHPPYEIPMSTLTIKQLHCQVPCTKSIDISDITIIGLAASSTTCEHMSCCVGLGIVRGVDSCRKILYLITPIPKIILKNIDILLHGFIKIPACLPQVQRHMTSNA